MRLNGHWLSSVLSQVERSDAELEAIPESPIAKVLHYISSVHRTVPGIRIWINGYERNVSEFTRHHEAYEYESPSAKMDLMEILKVLNPKLFLERSVFFEASPDTFLGQSSSFFVSVEQIRSLSPPEDMSEFVFVDGQQYDVTNVMVMDSDWLTMFYYDPIRKINEKSLGLSSMLLETSSETPRKKKTEVSKTSRRTDEMNMEDRSPARDSILWYIFLSILASVILTLVFISNAEYGLKVDTSDEHYEYSLWTFCVSQLNVTGLKCSTYNTAQKLGVASDPVEMQLSASRALFAVYPVVGCALLMASILKFWNRKSRRNAGRLIKSVIAILHFGYLMTMASVATRYFSQLDESLAGDVPVPNYKSANGLGIMLPWAAWLLSIFYTIVCCSWPLRAIFWVKPQVVPVR